MGLFAKCLINYGIEVTTFNNSLDFKASMGGPEKQATLRVGLYSVKSLAKEVARAMKAADAVNTYTVTVDRSVSGNTQNRIEIETNGAYLDLLFLTGTRTASNCATLLGYTVTDKTGATSYTTSTSCGSIIIPEYPPYEYQPLGSIHDARRSVNDSTSGVIETISFETFRNFEFQIKYIEEGSSDYAAFQAFHVWLLRGGPIEFIGGINDLNTLSVGVPINLRTPLELNRMTPGFYDFFETPKYVFREQG